MTARLLRCRPLPIGASREHDFRARRNADPAPAGIGAIVVAGAAEFV